MITEIQGIDRAKVLVVDDDPGARLLVGTALEMAGFRVVAAADGAAALAHFRDDPADCVVLDVVMPGMSGFDVCSALRALPECRHVPILMQTSLDDMESVNRAYNAGATDFSSKGINPMLLAQRVKFLVRAKQTQDQLRDSEARVRYLAYYDPLTGLPNRQRLLQILEQQVAWAAPRQRGLAVLMLDVDNFSRINDTQGQALGDALLQEVAHRLQNCLRDAHGSDQERESIRPKDISDWVARTGGDEFALALPGVVAADGAQVVAQRVQAALARPFVFAEQEITLTATMGVSLYPGDAATPEALVKNADAAMHHAKKSGQGGLEFFNKSISTRAAKHLSMEADLRKALERGEFTLNYQPRLALKDLRVEAVEALLQVAASATRLRRARRVHPAGRAERHDRRDRRLGAAGGERTSAPVAGRGRAALASRGECVGSAIPRRQPGVAGVAGHRCRRNRAAHDRTRVHRRRPDRIFDRGEQGGEVAQDLGCRHGAG